MLTLGSSRLASPLMTGMVKGRSPPGVRSITFLPSAAAAHCCGCAPRPRSRRTRRRFDVFGISSRPSMPSCVTGTSSRAARASPSEFGSMPTIAPISRFSDMRMILIIRSVPILPEPMIAHVIFAHVCPLANAARTARAVDARLDRRRPAGRRPSAQARRRAWYRPPAAVARPGPSSWRATTPPSADAQAGRASADGDRLARMLHHHAAMRRSRPSSFLGLPPRT